MNFDFSNFIPAELRHQNSELHFRKWSNLSIPHMSLIDRYLGTIAREQTDRFRPAKPSGVERDSAQFLLAKDGREEKDNGTLGI
ncbi:MAG TPA: hypothetical protein VIE66_19820 [Methylocella sp.]|jgi:hypothetical protein